MLAQYVRLSLIAGGALLGASGCAAPEPGQAPDIPATSRAAAEACASKLPPTAGIIYRDAAPDMHAETNMESLLRVKVMMLIVRDLVRRTEARPAAEQAAECLEL